MYRCDHSFPVCVSISSAGFKKMKIQKLLLVFLTTLATSLCSPLPNAGVTGHYLAITPGKTQIKAIHSKLIFTCTLVIIPQSNETNPLQLDQPVILWKGPNSNYITNQKGRVYTEKLDERRVRLYITEVEESDSGSYSCETNFNGAFRTTHNHLELFEDIQFQNGSSQFQESVGSTVLLECSAFGKPKPEISWRFRGRKIISGANSGKYVCEQNGLRIYNVTKDDNGTYECRAQVASHGNLKVRHVNLFVMYPPEWISPPKTPLAIRGNDVTLDCKAEGNPPVTYKWFKELTTLSGIQETPLRDDDYDDDDDDDDDDNYQDDVKAKGELKIKSIELADQGRYICRASNDLGSRDVHYDVKVLVVPLITVPSQSTVVEGRTIVIPCEAAGIPSPSINWFRKGDNGKPETVNITDGVDVSVNVTSGGISRLTIANADRKRHSEKYTCVANNTAGFDSKDTEIIVETLPKASISADDLIGWKGERRQVTCLATGLPFPTIAWIHEGKSISVDHQIQITTLRDAENVTSLLEVRFDDVIDNLFGNYSCIAKNIHGHVAKVVQLRRAFPPEAPRNITVLQESQNSISLSVAVAAPQPGTPYLPLIKWILKYEKSSDNTKSESNNSQLKPGQTINLLYAEGTSIDVGNLDPDTKYTMYLSAANAAGIGPSIKFQARTTPAAATVIHDVIVEKKYHHVHDDENGGYQGDDSGSMEESLRREAIALEKDVILDNGLLADWGGISIGLVIGIFIMLAILVVTVSGAIVHTKRNITARRAVMTVVKTKGKTEGSGMTTTITVSEGKDIDNLKVETNRPKTSVGPIPGDKFGSLGSRKNLRTSPNLGGGPAAATCVSNTASPVMARTAVVSPTLGTQTETVNTAQSQAWQSMLLKAEAEARDEALLQELEAEDATKELPHPPLELLLNTEKDNETMNAEEDDMVEDGEDEASRTKDGEFSDDSMSLASEDGCFQKAPQFEGKSFLQY